MSNGTAPSISGLSSSRRRDGHPEGLALQPARQREDPLPRPAGRLRVPPVRRREEGGPRGRLGGLRAADAGVDLRGDGGRARGAAPGGGRRARRHGPDGPLRLPRLADHPEGARRRLPDVAASPLAPLGEAGGDPEGAERGRERDPRLLPLPRVHEGRLADPDAERLRGDLEPLRDAVHRGREGLPLAVGPALPRARVRGARQGLLLRPDVPGREVEDAAAPARVLDGRARGRLPGDRRPARPRRGVHQGADGARPRPPEGGPEASRAGHDEARGDGDEALPADRPTARRSRTWRARDSR